MNDIVLEARDLHKTYHDGKLDVAVLYGVNLQLRKGEQIAIMGSSGSGKSTLLHLLGGLDKPTTGEVMVAGKNIHQVSEKERCELRNQQLGFVYQLHHLLPEFTVLENVCMPLLLRKNAIDESIVKAEAILKKVGLSHRLRHKLAELSGGERQRTAIARALITEPACVLADEPTGNLDRRTAEGVYETMLELNHDFQTSFIIVTHDPTLAARMDRVYDLTNGILT